MRGLRFAGLSLLGVSFFYLAGWADSPREIPSAMTARETETYLSGSPFNELLPAETYGYPNPQRILELDRELGLTDEQKKKIQPLAVRMRNDASFFGKKIIAQELLLDDYFRKGETDPAALANRVESIGLLRWRLRYSLLSVCVFARNALTDEQLKKYRELTLLSSTGNSSK